MSDRPEPPYDAPEGCEWFTKVEGPRWRIQDGSPCRSQSGNGRRHQVCRRPSVAALNRGLHGTERWWAYCEQHLYGQWIEDGQIMAWYLRPEPVASSGRAADTEGRP